MIADRLTHAGMQTLKLHIAHEEKNSDEIAKLMRKKPLDVRANMRFYELNGWGKIARRGGLFWFTFTEKVKTEVALVE